MYQGGGGGKADTETLLAGGQPQTESNMGLAGAAVAKGDDVLMAIDVFAAGELEHQRLVERGYGLEVEGIEAFDHREAGRLDAALDQAAFAVDQLELGQPLEIADMIDAFGGALPGQLVIFPQEGWQPQCLEVVVEQQLRGIAHRPTRSSRLI